MKTITINSIEELPSAAHAFLADMGDRTVVALHGEMGAGKTTFINTLCRELGVETDATTSPTFALVNEYRPPRVSGRPPVFHFDMYRITSEDDLYSIGYDDYLDRGICLVEWSENIPYDLPEDYLRLTIEKCGIAAPDHRQITVVRVAEDE
jgi:tRNA threonylcarbamoyladenosine biosynthesis protein TsaE